MNSNYICKLNMVVGLTENHLLIVLIVFQMQNGMVTMFFATILKVFSLELHLLTDGVKC